MRNEGFSARFVDKMRPLEMRITDRSRFCTENSKIHMLSKNVMLALLKPVNNNHSSRHRSSNLKAFYNPIDIKTDANS